MKYFAMLVESKFICIYKRLCKSLHITCRTYAYLLYMEMNGYKDKRVESKFIAWGPVRGIARVITWPCFASSFSIEIF